MLDRPDFTTTLNFPNVSAAVSPYSGNIPFMKPRDKGTGLPASLLQQYHERHFRKYINTGYQYCSLPGVNYVLHWNILALPPLY